MNRHLISLSMIILLAPRGLAAAQGVRIPGTQRTTVPPDARFEILQSNLAVKLTLRVDRYSGGTDQLVMTSDSTVAWQPITKIPHPVNDLTTGGRPNYAVFTSGLSVRFTYLMNVNTGATWQLVEEPRLGWFWSPIK